MIQLYAKGQTDFSKNGITLRPSEATVTWQENGQYDLELVFPVTDDMPEMDYGMVVRCTVPEQRIGDIDLGEVSYWTVNGNGTKLYAEIPTTQRVSYNAWAAGTLYHIGDKVTYNGQNYQATAQHIATLVNVPGEGAAYWETIPNYSGSSGKVAATLNAGDVVIRTGDFNATYMQAADTDGHSGYIKIEECTDSGDTDERTIPGWTIREQSFTITEIRKDDNGGKTLRVTLEHVSYQLRRTMVGPCNLTEATPATAVLFIQGAMEEAYPGEILTNMSGRTVTSDFSWKNAQADILDPKAGLLQALGGMIIRDDFNVFLLEEPAEAPAYAVRYGANMKSVRWSGDAGNLVSRVYPTAQAEDGRTILLPEKYIDSARTVPFVAPEMLPTGLKIGEKVTATDGTETVLTEQDVYTRMRAAANDRFTKDKADQPKVTLELDWIHMPDTEEYRQYAALKNAAPGEWVAVYNGPMGISVNIRMTGYTWDPILCRYKGTTFGDVRPQATVAGYSLKSGAVTARAIAAGAVGSEALQAGSITAREVAANSITAEQIASRSIVTELLAAEAVTADEIAANAITAQKIAAYAITAEKIAAGAVEADKILAGAVTAAAIAAGAVIAEKIASGAVVTEKLDAEAVTAAKIAAGAVTTAKLDAGAVTAQKIAAGAISADKIDTSDLAAIQATLQIATIANAQIASADINYAHIKDLDAQSAYFGQAVFQEALGGKLYVPRLAANYAQIVNATISDLVIQATNDLFYKLDVDLAGNVTATQVTPSAQEIEDGHTADGRTIYLGTDIVASDLNTMNIYASHALMDEITANLINVDKLWARQAFINALNVQDLSSNTYIQSVVGNWQSQSTITQTVNSLSSRIDQLGYGTIFYSETEPSHENLVAGDIWIEPVEDNTWDDIAEYTWDELASFTWEQVAGKYRMYVWTGEKFKILYDNLIISELQTEINQNAYAITLKANQSAVDVLSGQVSSFAAELEVQSQAITAAVSSVNSKVANYTRLTDPADDPLITLNAGDTWTKAAGDGTWDSLADYTWDELSSLSWDEIAGASVYTWDGIGWIQTADYGATIQNRAMLEILDRSITLLVEQTEHQGDEITRAWAQLTIQADMIAQEVARATTAEAGKIDKTTQYQTADAIVSEAVSEAVSQAGTSAAGLYLAKTTSYQTAEQIVTAAVQQAASAAAGAYIAKTTAYQTADAIASEAIRVSGVNAANAYIAKTTNITSVADLLADSQAKADAAATTAKNASIAKTTTYQTADAIVSAAVAQAATAAGQTYIAKTNTYQTADAIASAAEAYTDGRLTNYSTTSQTAQAIAAYVGDNAYGKVSGITIAAAGVDISGSQYVRIASGGAFRVTSGDFGVKSDAAENDYVLWSGSSTPATASFRVKKNGEVTLTKLMALNEQGQETEINLRTYELWKLYYQTIKQLTITTDSAGYCTSFQLSNGTTVNFNRAGAVTLSGAWTDNWTRYTVTAKDGAGRTIATQSSGQVTADKTNAQIKAALEAASSHSTLLIVEADGEDILVRTIDASGVYTQGRESVDSYDSVAMQLRADSEHSGLITFQIELENDKVITGQKYVTWE